jgi:hypothetical protein
VAADDGPDQAHEDDLRELRRGQRRFRLRAGGLLGLIGFLLTWDGASTLRYFNKLQAENPTSEMNRVLPIWMRPQAWGELIAGVVCLALALGLAVVLLASAERFQNKRP